MNRWISDHYRSRRGLLNTYRHKLLFMLGKYTSYQQVDWSAVHRLVFVCKGNICRSAFAEAVARSSGVESISCGIDTVNGAPANKSAVNAAKDIDIDLSQHRTTPIQDVIFERGDLIIAMEPDQLGYLQQYHGKNNTLTLLGLWGRPKNPYIQDPYGGSSAYFKYCFNYIELSVYEITSKISSKY